VFRIEFPNQYFEKDKLSPDKRDYKVSFQKLVLSLYREKGPILVGIAKRDGTIMLNPQKYVLYHITLAEDRRE